VALEWSELCVLGNKRGHSFILKREAIDNGWLVCVRWDWMWRMRIVKCFYFTFIFFCILKDVQSSVSTSYLTTLSHSWRKYLNGFTFRVTFTKFETWNNLIIFIKLQRIWRTCWIWISNAKCNRKRFLIVSLLFKRKQYDIWPCKQCFEQMIGKQISQNN
jgi:hypothetical protein